MCDHVSVMRSLSEPVVWACQLCGTEFLPADHTESALDGIAAVQEAVLWGLIQRVAEQINVPSEELDEELRQPFFFGQEEADVQP